MVWFCVHELSWIGQSIGTESRLVIAKGYKEGESGVSASGYGVYFGGDKNVQELVVTVSQPCEDTKNIESYMLKRWIL